MNYEGFTFQDVATPTIQRRGDRSDAKDGFATPEYVHDDISTSDQMQAANEALTKAVWQELQYYYPGHPWHVSAGLEKNIGLIQIRLLGISNWGWNIKIGQLRGWPDLKQTIKKGAGEMLERWRMPRSGFSLADWNAALNKYRPIFNMNTRPPE